MYKIIAWNVNSIRALIKKFDLNTFLQNEKPHIFCMSETKLSCPDIQTRELLKKSISGFRNRYYSTCTTKKGYSGTAIWSKKKPLNVIYGINSSDENIIIEGRVITLEFNDFFLIHVYTPNSGETLQRLNYRTNIWDVAFFTFAKKLQKEKPIIICGDLNCARYDIDIHSPKTNLKTAGFTIQERNSFNSYIEKLNLIDTFRELHPDEQKYTYWSYRTKARKNNRGWRIDYFLVSSSLMKFIKQSKIFTDVPGSDHCAISIKLKIS